MEAPGTAKAEEVLVEDELPVVLLPEVELVTDPELEPAVFEPDSVSVSVSVPLADDSMELWTSVTALERLSTALETSVATDSITEVASVAAESMASVAEERASVGVMTLAPVPVSD